jgi:hypothetical protein
MGYTLTLEVSEEIYKPLARAAQKSGQTLEELAVEWLVLAMHTVQDDPLEEFIGGFASDLPDWTEKSDVYLGQALLQEMRQPTEESAIHA